MVTYSVTATVTRSTQFGRNEFRRIGMTSGDAEKEFAAAVDLTVTPLPTFPILVLTPNIEEINFLCIQVTGGNEAIIRLSQSNQYYNNIDLKVSGTVIMSGVSLQQVTVMGCSDSCYIEVFGMGN